LNVFVLLCGRIWYVLVHGSQEGWKIRVSERNTLNKTFVRHCARLLSFTELRPAKGCKNELADRVVFMGEVREILFWRRKSWFWDFPARPSNRSSMTMKR